MANRLLSLPGICVHKDRKYRLQLIHGLEFHIRSKITKTGTADLC